jgi:hypothetical protein
VILSDWNKKKSIALSLLVVICVFIVFALARSSGSPLFFSYDPYYHQKISLDIVKEGEYNDIEVACIDGSEVIYKSVLHQIGALPGLVNEDYVGYFYEYAGFFLTFVLALLLFFITKSPLSVVLLMTYKYLMYRSLITYPETMVLVLYTAVILLIKERRYAWGFILLSLFPYIHYKSFAFAGVLYLGLVAGYLMTNFKVFRDKKNFGSKVKLLLKTGWPYVIGLILLLPFISTLYEQVITYITYHFGSSAKILTVDNDTVRYESMNLMSMWHWVSPWFASVCAVSLGIRVYFKQKINIRKILTENPAYWGTIFSLLIIFSLFLIGPSIGIQIPAYRMLSYFGIPLIIILTEWLTFRQPDLTKHDLDGKVIYYLGVALIVILGSMAPFTNFGYKGIGEEDFAAVNYAKDNYSDVLIISPTPVARDTGLLTDCSRTKNIYFETTPKEMNDYYVSEYGMDVYLLVTREGHMILEEKYPSFYDKLIPNQIVNFEDTVIYYLDKN